MLAHPLPNYHDALYILLNLSVQQESEYFMVALNILCMATCVTLQSLSKLRYG